MCESVIKDATLDGDQMLKYCAFVSENMLKNIQGIPHIKILPKKERFNFIKDYDVDLLQKIAMVRPNLKKYIKTT